MAWGAMGRRSSSTAGLLLSSPCQACMAWWLSPAGEVSMHGVVAEPVTNLSCTTNAQLLLRLNPIRRHACCPCRA